MEVRWAFNDGIENVVSDDQGSIAVSPRCRRDNREHAGGLTWVVKAFSGANIDEPVMPGAFNIPMPALAVTKIDLVVRA
jgi:hypothetical protein